MRLYLLFDLIGKISALIYALFECKSFFNINKIAIIQSIQEITSDIGIGFFLMVSTISSTFIVGVIRIFIQREWSIGMFGKISLSVQLSNFVLSFVRAVSLPLFPYLRNTDRNKAISLYGDIRLILTVVVFSLLLFFFL